MATAGERSRPADRERGLRLVRSWTVAASVAGIGMTGVLAVVAAQSFAGRNTAAAAATETAPTINPGSNSDDSSNAAPQTVPPGSFGNSSQAPAAVSGGS